MEHFTRGKHNPSHGLIRIYQPGDHLAVLALHHELQAYERPLRASRFIREGLLVMRSKLIGLFSGD